MWVEPYCGASTNIDKVTLHILHIEEARVAGRAGNVYRDSRK